MDVCVFISRVPIKGKGFGFLLLFFKKVFKLFWTIKGWLLFHTALRICMFFFIDWKNVYLFVNMYGRFGLKHILFFYISKTIFSLIWETLTTVKWRTDKFRKRFVHHKQTRLRCFGLIIATELKATRNFFQFIFKFLLLLFHPFFVGGISATWCSCLFAVSWL